MIMASSASIRRRTAMIALFSVVGTYTTHPSSYLIGSTLRSLLAPKHIYLTESEA